MTFNSGLTGINPDRPGLSFRVPETDVGERDISVAPIRVPFQFSRRLRAFTIASLKNAWQEKNGTRRSCIATISVSTTCRLNYFREWWPFDPRRIVSRIDATINKKKNSVIQEKTSDASLTLHPARESSLPYDQLHVTRFSLIHRQRTMFYEFMKKNSANIAKMQWYSISTFSRIQSRIYPAIRYSVSVSFRIIGERTNSISKVLMRDSKPHVRIQF